MKPLDKLMARFTAVFGEPRSPDPVLFADEYARALRGFDGAVLMDAASEVADSFVPRFAGHWPSPAETRKVALRLTADRYQPPPPPPERDVPPPTPEMIARCRALLEDAKRAMAAHALEQPPSQPWADTSRPAFEAMQRSGPNRALHARPITQRGGDE